MGRKVSKYTHQSPGSGLKDIQPYPVHHAVRGTDMWNLWLYIISESEDVHKVGIASHPWSRVQTLQVGNHRPLHLTDLWVGPKWAITALERRVLEQTTEWNMGGEWRRCTRSDLVSTISFAAARMNEAING